MTNSVESDVQKEWQSLVTGQFRNFELVSTLQTDVWQLSINDNSKTQQICTQPFYSVNTAWLWDNSSQNQ